MEKKLKKLGDSFRGLWKSCEVKDGHATEDKWTVTFILDNKYVESPMYDNAEDALDFAIETLTPQNN